MRSGFGFRLVGFVPVNFKKTADIVEKSTKFTAAVQTLKDLGFEFDEEAFGPAKRRDAGELELTEKVDPKAEEPKGK